MQPSELTAQAFAAYPVQARRLAVAHLDLLRRVPLPLLPLLLRELIAYDWRFPREQRAIDGQIAYLDGLRSQQLAEAVNEFRVLKLPESLSAVNWVANPAGYVEQLTAALWSTGQMPPFRRAAEEYAERVAAASPAERSPEHGRLCLVVLGHGVGEAKTPLFRRLRKEGVYLSNVDPREGLAVLHEAVWRRAALSAGGGEGGAAKTLHSSYAHWIIDGGQQEPLSRAAAGANGQRAQVVELSYQALGPARLALLGRMQRAIDSGVGGPEELRSLVARLQPGDVSLTSGGGDPVLEHFQLTLLTEGSGTQIFATTFVQWAARECLRRAQPETLLLHFAPRQRQRGMDELLRGETGAEPDAEGSLVDAEMAAAMTWGNMQRLPGAEQARMLVWFEDHREALVIGPGLPKGTSSGSTVTMEQVVRMLA